MGKILFKKIDDNKSICLLCSHFCVLQDNEKGKCGVRQNISGQIVSLVKNKIAAKALDPIEKKPLFHVLPGSFSYSIGSPGCNFTCKFCQNASLAQSPAILNEIDAYEVIPQNLVKEAVASKAKSISYTYSEPTVFFELMKDTALVAKEKGLLNIMVSNGFISSQGFDEIKEFIDAANIDLKSFNNDFYEKICGGKLKPVLETLKRMKKAGIFIEVTTLLISGINDSKEEIEKIARFINNELGKDTPWHISAFHPCFKMTDIKRTSADTIHKAIETGQKHGLFYIYSGNIFGDDFESTLCPKCQNKVVERKGFYVIENRIKNGKCFECGYNINGIFE
ncbi:MAG: AmmeMemoRadiSam system radical SAM enzyme [Desulfobacteraceae bacterium]|nr:AmmeMemoRadiSam system radical SAM enzyme [Desulfobacteraceae bacterium]